MSAIEAMELSSQEDRIVHLKWSLPLENDLYQDCDDSGEDEDTVEFWGDDWRVHLHK